MADKDLELRKQELAELKKIGDDIKRQNQIEDIKKDIADSRAKARRAAELGQEKLAKESLEAISALETTLNNNQNQASVNARALESESIKENLTAIDRLIEADDLRQEKEEEINKKRDKKRDESAEKGYEKIRKQSAENQKKRDAYAKENRIKNAAIADGTTTLAERLKHQKDEREKQTKQFLEGLSTDGPGINKLVENMNTQTALAQNSDAMLEKQFKEATFLRMDMAGDEGIAGLRDQFKQLQEMEAKGLLTDQQSIEIRKKISDGINDREKQREAEEANELQQMALTRIGDSVSMFGEKLGNFGQSAVATGGLLAGLVGLVLGVIDPELLSEIITKLTTGFLDIITGIKLIITGDVEGGMGKIKENIGLFAGLILGIALYFGGPVISAIGGLFGKLAKLVKFMRVFKVFMLTQFVPGMMSMLTGALTGLGAVLIPILPIVIIIGLIAAAFMVLKNQLGEGASVMDALKLGALYLVDGLSFIVNGLTFLPRKIFEFLGGGRLARWLFGDEAGDMVDQFLGEGLKTNRASEFKAKKQTELAAKQRDKEAQEAAAEAGVYGDADAAAALKEQGIDMNLENAQSENQTAKIAAGAGGQPSIQTNSSASVSQSSTASVVYEMNQPSLAQAQMAGIAGR